MAKSKRNEKVQVQQPTPPTMDEAADESDVEFQLDGEPERDETERELERLVFGDSAGFREGLDDASQDDEASEQEDEEEDGDGQPSGMEGLDDAALFFTDTGAE
ncbi:hypothetical protein KC324_g20961, partial [Hortaea werneckii]